MTRTYFADFGSGEYLSNDMGNVEIMLCSRRVGGTSSIILAEEGNYDVLNFMWFKGSEGLYVPTGGNVCLLDTFSNLIQNDTNSIDLACSLSGFINPYHTACLQCNTDYYMVEKQCMDSCPIGYVLHEGTQSCQSKSYSSASFP